MMHISFGYVCQSANFLNVPHIQAQSKNGE